MNVMLWNIGKVKYEEFKNIKHIYQSISKTYFKLDDKKYLTSEYDLQFVDSEV